MDPLTLAAQLRNLSVIGKRTGETDGSAATNEASPAVRLAMAKLTSDAGRYAQHYTDVGRGLPASEADSDLTVVVNSYTAALIACTEAGMPPPYFDPKELTGH